jgi:hypothetical protein
LFIWSRGQFLVVFCRFDAQNRFPIYNIYFGSKRFALAKAYWTDGSVGIRVYLRHVAERIRADVQQEVRVPQALERYDSKQTNQHLPPPPPPPPPPTTANQPLPKKERKLAHKPVAERALADVQQEVPSSRQLLGSF